VSDQVPFSTVVAVSRLPTSPAEAAEAKEHIQQHMLLLQHHQEAPSYDKGLLLLLVLQQFMLLLLQPLCQPLLAVVFIHSFMLHL
jgi:hypothetical protein